MDLRILKKKKTMGALGALVVALWPSLGAALSVGELEADGYRALSCTFTERCLIGAPCERAWRDFTWMIDADAGTAYEVGPDGDLRRGIAMLDARWKTYSEARAIVMPLREGIASQMTMFHDGTAVYTIQYPGGAGSGQVYRGACTVAEEDAG